MLTVKQETGSDFHIRISSREENVSLELMTTYHEFNCKMMRLSLQPFTALKCV